MLTASVVVCTRNRARQLCQTLSSIMADDSATPRDFIVVDNASSDTTAEVVRSFPGVRYVREEAVGVSHARNAGVRAATGDVIVATDDDVTVAAGWCDAMVRPFGDPTIEVVGGNITPLWTEPPPVWFDQRIGLLVALPQYGSVSREMGPDEWPVGACIAYRRASLQAMDTPFSPRLGPRPGLSINHEEMALVRLLSQRGRVWYANDARVQHRIAAERVRVPALRRAAFQAGIGNARMMADETRAAPRPLRSTREVAIWILKLAVAVRRRRQPCGLTAKAVADECRAAMWLGAAVENLLGRWPALTESIGRAFPS
jgi:GT2 family glycosyltransferase